MIKRINGILYNSDKSPAIMVRTNGKDKNDPEFYSESLMEKLGGHPFLYKQGKGISEFINNLSDPNLTFNTEEIVPLTKQEAAQWMSGLADPMVVSYFFGDMSNRENAEDPYRASLKISQKYMDLLDRIGEDRGMSRTETIRWMLAHYDPNHEIESSSIKMI